MTFQMVLSDRKQRPKLIFGWQKRRIAICVWQKMHIAAGDGALNGATLAATARSDGADVDAANSTKGATLWASLPAAPGSRPLCQAVAAGEKPRRLEFGGLEARDRWAANRASGWFPTKGVGVGGAPGSEASRQRHRLLTLVCGAPGCTALVNRARARQHAHKAGRTSFAAGDGCASRVCSRAFRAKRFQQAQAKVAREVEAGERLLMRWQAGLDDHEVWLEPADVVRRSVAEARRGAGLGGGQ